MALVRWFVVVTWIVGATGCSWLFHDRLSGGLADYEPRSEPRCSTAHTWVVLDGVFAGLGALSLIGGLLSKEDDSIRTEFVVGGALDLVIHGASAFTGKHWINQCREAHAIWNDDGSNIVTASDENERRRLARQFSSNPKEDPANASAFWCGERQRCTTQELTCTGMCEARQKAWCAETDLGHLCSLTRGGCVAQVQASGAVQRVECTEREAGLWKQDGLPSPTSSPSSSADPRGYFCASSPTSPAGICAREKADCERARDAILAAVADLARCSLIETVHCYTAAGSERCLDTAERCTAQSASAADVTLQCTARR